MPANFVQPHFHDTETFCYAKGITKALGNSAASKPEFTAEYASKCELEQQVIALLDVEDGDAAPFQLITALLCGVIKQNTAITKSITALEANLTRANNTIASLSRAMYTAQPPPQQQVPKTPKQPATQPGPAPAKAQSFAAKAATPPPPPPTLDPVDFPALPPAGGPRQKKNKAPESERPLPTSERRFYSALVQPVLYSDVSDGAITNRVTLATQLPVILGKAIQDAGHGFPMTAISVSVNSVGTVSVTAPTSTPSSLYAPLFLTLTSALNTFNKSLHPETSAGHGEYTLFKCAPTNVDVAIHNVPTFATGQNNDSLFEALSHALLYSRNVQIISARFLRKDIADRKATTTVIVTVTPENAERMSSSAHLFSKSRRCNVMWSSTPATQCRHCYKHGHATQGCMAEHPICPICSDAHKKGEHRCFNTACKGTARNDTPCCTASPSKCPNCQGAHTATSPSCPAKIAAIQRAAFRRGPAAPTTTDLINEVFAADDDEALHEEITEIPLHHFEKVIDLQQPMDLDTPEKPASAADESAPVPQ